jgi:hypothetical protein
MHPFVTETQFGFIYIDSENFNYDPGIDFSDTIASKAKHNSIIWSNSVYLDNNK